MSKSIKLISFFLTLTLILNSFVILSSAEVSKFYINEAVIIISENPSITDKYAAGRLKYYLDEITGGDIKILADSEHSEYEIRVGQTNRSDDLSASSDGSYIIKSDENTVIINGSGNKGTINGVYAFLEKFYP